MDTSKYILRIGRLVDNNVISLDKTDLLVMIENNRNILKSIIQFNNESMAHNSTNEVESWCPRFKLEINKQGHINLYRRTVERRWAVWGNTDLENILNQMAYFERAIRANKNRKFDYYSVVLHKKSDIAIDMSICVLNDTGCSKCGVILHSNSLRRHIDTQSCRTRAADHKNSIKKWVRVTNVYVVEAIKKANIEHEDVPVLYNTWAPEWVAKAAKLYRSSDKYAGMKFSEYLTKMKGG